VLPDPTIVGLLVFLVTSLATLVGLGARAIIRGDLVPRQSVEFTTKNWKEQLQEEKDKSAEWKSLYEAERAFSANSRENRDILLAVSKTMDKVLGSLPTARDKNVGG